MLELLFEVVAELLLQILLEAAVELGLHAFSDPDRIRPGPFVAALAYTLFGALIGGISLLVFPSYFVSAEGWRIANLLLTPVAAGLLMAYMGSVRARRGLAVLRIDRFAYAYLFALSLALVRFFWAR